MLEIVTKQRTLAHRRHQNSTFIVIIFSTRFSKTPTQCSRNLQECNQSRYMTDTKFCQRIYRFNSILGYCASKKIQLQSCLIINKFELSTDKDKKRTQASSASFFSCSITGLFLNQSVSSAYFLNIGGERLMSAVTFVAPINLNNVIERACHG